MFLLAIVTVSELTDSFTQCFIAGTLVLTSLGLKKIEEIKVGDKVWSYNEKTKKKELKRVKNIFRNKTNKWLHLIVKINKSEEEVICTPNHRIYVKEKGWIEALKILENDELLLYNNIKCKVIKKELQHLENEETTYNFEVEDNHNYYVTENKILVHNKCLNDEKSIFEVFEFDEQARAKAREGNPSFRTFKRRLFKYQNELTPNLFSEYKVGLNPKINGKKVILHHPQGRKGIKLYNVVGVTQVQHLEIHHCIGYIKPDWDKAIYILGKGEF